MIALMSALGGELSSLLKATEVRSVQKWGGGRFHEGRLEGREVVIARSGVGKAFSAAVTQRLIDLYDPEGLIFTGVAGAINPDLAIGDLLIGRDCLQHDLDATALGFPLGRVPGAGPRVVRADPQLLALASRYTSDRHAVRVGRILTGDRFLGKAELGRRTPYRDKLAGDVVEMEGAAVALVCRINRVPHLVARFVSDNAGGTGGLPIWRLLQMCSGRALEFLRWMLVSLPPR